MTNVTNVDFGAEEAAKNRVFQERLNYLLDLVKQRDDDYLKNPTKFFSKIGKEIYDRDQVLHKAHEALLGRTPVLSYAESWTDALKLPETRMVDAGELERLRACAKIVEDWANR